MINDDLITYVRASTEAGLQKSTIRQSLLEAGWDPGVVEKALAIGAIRVKTPSVDSIKTTRRRFRVPRPKSISLRQAAPVLISILLIAGAWFYNQNKNDQYTIFLPESGKTVTLEYGSWPALEDANFFSEVKAAFINEGTDFIESDLSEMKLRVYKDGKLSGEVPIASKGREGSWWETPAGLYKIQGKEENHFSSFGQVYMPWSMPFQGNFFIHGWPYYPNGESVPQSYSGGCIRLSTEDAKEVFSLAEVGMPVLVHEHDFASDDFDYELFGESISANNYLAADLGSNFVFAEKEAGQVVPIASVTKLMTAVIATEYINIEREVTITEGMLTQTSLPRLQAGQRVSVFNLLFPLLMESSNEAGTAIASILGSNRFVELMNTKAEAIGMRSTHFADPNGISPENTSSAEDLFLLAKYLYNNRSFVLDMSNGGANQSVYGKPIWQGLRNFNVFDDDEDFVGGKVGMTQAAGETILSVFKIEKAGQERPVVVIALGSENRAAAAAALINYVRSNY